MNNAVSPGPVLGILSVMLQVQYPIFLSLTMMINEVAAYLGQLYE